MKKMISISKAEIHDKMFFVRDDDSEQPIAVIKVADLLKKHDEYTDNHVIKIEIIEHHTFANPNDVSSIDFPGTSREDK